MLATYPRREILTLAQCKKLLAYTERFMQVAQCEVKRDAALAVAVKYAIMGYGAQYVTLAQNLNAPLMTEDRKLREAVPNIAFPMRDYWVQ